MAPVFQNRFSFLSAACDKEKLPSVGYSSNTYSNSELVPGETATITCSSGYEFKGELVPTATEMPQLPPGQREPARGKRTIKKRFLRIFPKEGVGGVNFFKTIL